MSITWSREAVGYDGDLIYGHVTVSYWQPREYFEAEVEKQIAAIREGMMAERDRLMADMEQG